MSFQGAAGIPALARMAEIQSRFGRRAGGVLASTTTPTPSSGSTSPARAASSDAFASAFTRATTAVPGATGVTGAAPAAAPDGPVLSDATPYADLFRSAGATYGVDPSLLA